MNRFLQNNSGLTLVELMVTIFISAIIAGTITSYLVTNLKMYKTTQEITNIQYDGQLILNQISEIAMESRGIKDIKDNSVANWEITSTITNPEYIIFEGINSYDIFVYDDLTKELYYFNVENEVDINPTINATSEYDKHIFAKNINRLTLLTDNMLGDCSVIEINIELISGDAKLKVQTEAKFRNKKD